MSRWLVRASATALFGALAGAVCFAAFYGSRPGVTLEMDRDPPAFTSGFYPSERAGDLTFVWTSRRADVTLAAVDRRRDWTCSITFRGGRPPGIPQPDLALSSDGVKLATVSATNDFQTVTIVAPARPEIPGLRLSVVSSPTFVPSESDPRTLGVQVDRIVCAPVSGSLLLPPRRALLRAAAAGGMWGAAFALAGLASVAALAASTAVAVVQAMALTMGAAAYTSFPETMTRFAAAVAALTIGATLVLSWREKSLSPSARFVVIFSAVAFYLKLLALSHPAKSPVDAVFHAHRLEWVLAGRYYFTQLSTSGTPFPYAIGLYVFSLPWTVFTRDHVTLLRVVVCTADAVAGALLYPVIVRTWGHRLAGAIAVVLFSVVPVSYVVIGNANLTNAFGQSVSIITVLAATLWTLGVNSILKWIALAALASLGLTSHISTFTLLMPTLLMLAAMTWWRGGPELRSTARSVFVATLAAVLCSVVLYWSHFTDVYAKQLARVGSGVADTAKESPPTSVADVRNREPDTGTGLGRTYIPLSGRVAGAISQTVANIGWPILTLACVGLWRVWKERRRDPLVFALIAWGGVALAFVLFSVLSATDIRYQQDAWEFIGRVEHATYPAAVVLAAYGAAWAWRAGNVFRAASALLLLCAVSLGARQWWGWLS